MIRSAGAMVARETSKMELVRSVSYISRLRVRVPRIPLFLAVQEYLGQINIIGIPGWKVGRPVGIMVLHCFPMQEKIGKDSRFDPWAGLVPPFVLFAKRISGRCYSKPARIPSRILHYNEETVVFQLHYTKYSLRSSRRRLRRPRWGRRWFFA